MIIEFAARNFFSFKTKFRVSFVGKSKVANNSELYFQENGLYLSKLMMVIGPNASGKSNVLSALGFITHFIANSFADSKFVESHFFSSQNAKSKCELLFNLQKHTYRYELQFLKERVCYEALFIKHQNSFRYLFKRIWNTKSKNYDYINKDFPFTPKMALQTRANASIISTANQYNISLANKLADFFSESYARYNNDHLSFTSQYAAHLFSNNEKLSEQMQRMLQKMDLGLSSIEINNLERPNSQRGAILGKRYAIHGIHTDQGRQARLPLYYESNGTQMLFSLLGQILPALEKGRLVIIDELDRDLHPDMLAHVLNLFINQETNPYNAQLIFTSHLHEPLLFLNKDQVLLVGKDENLCSHAWKISDIKGLRADENIYKRYKAGAYGAIPNLD